MEPGRGLPTIDELLLLQSPPKPIRNPILLTSVDNLCVDQSSPFKNRARILLIIHHLTLPLLEPILRRAIVNNNCGQKDDPPVVFRKVHLMASTLNPFNLLPLPPLRFLSTTSPVSWPPTTPARARDSAAVWRTPGFSTPLSPSSSPAFLIHLKGVTPIFSLVHIL